MWKAVVDAFNGHGDKPESHKGGQTYDFEQIRSFVNSRDKSKTIIDVREPSEYSECHIPGVHNMPFKTEPLALSKPSVEFKQNFGFEKLVKDQELVFLCASGFRAGKARDEALEAGYKVVSVYPGSMNEWIAKGGEKA
ncbi:LAFA_0E07998g1_1 [Lachancea sp. 'fantastica']|nr:LAFA_0E07998g1_1 [Lachancea sp. 'fantastica']